MKYLLATAAVAVLGFVFSAVASGATVVVAGDIACATTDPYYFGGNGDATHCAQKRTANLIGSILGTIEHATDRVIPLGDQQYNSGQLSQFQAVYHPTWGRFKAISRPVPGNHEYGTSGASGYFQYFGSLAGPPPGYYAWNFAGWRMIALNNECSHIGATACANQVAWLKNELAANPRRCTLAYFHEPRFNSGSFDSDATAAAPMWDALYDAGADVVLNGHKHFYERFHPLNKAGAVDQARGIRSFIVGTGGHDQAATPTRRTGSATLKARVFGVLELTLRTGAYDWKFHPLPGTTTYTDSGTGTCH